MLILFDCLTDIILYFVLRVSFTFQQSVGSVPDALYCCSISMPNKYGLFCLFFVVLLVWLVWLVFFGGLFVCCCFPAVKLPAFITHFCLMTLLHTCVQHFVQVKQNGGKCVKLHTNICLLSCSVKFCNGAGLQAFFLKGAKSLLR